MTPAAKLYAQQLARYQPNPDHVGNIRAAALFIRETVPGLQGRAAYEALQGAADELARRDER